MSGLVGLIEGRRRLTEATASINAQIERGNDLAMQLGYAEFELSCALAALEEAKAIAIDARRSGFHRADELWDVLHKTALFVAPKSKADAWDEGWDLGNEYALSEPFDDRAARNKNPYRKVAQ